MFAGYAIAAAIGIASYFINAREVKQEEIEMRSARNVVFTILLAERDREYLKQLRRNRDEESKLMAKVKDWEVSSSSFEIVLLLENLYLYVYIYYKL